MARVGTFTPAGVDPATGRLAGPDPGAQTRRIPHSFGVTRTAAASDLGHVVHINIFLKNMSDFEAVNVACAAATGDARPARTVCAVAEPPRPGVLLTMNPTAVTRG